MTHNYDDDNKNHNNFEKGGDASSGSTISNPKPSITDKTGPTNNVNNNSNEKGDNIPLPSSSSSSLSSSSPPINNNYDNGYSKGKRGRRGKRRSRGRRTLYTFSYCAFTVQKHTPYFCIFTDIPVPM